MIAIRRLGSPVLMVIAGLLMAFGVACGNGDGGALTLTGQVVTVVPASVTGLAELEVIDDDGMLWRFEASGFVGLTSSHLEEHRALGQPVTVEYFEEDGRLVIRLMTDG